MVPAHPAAVVKRTRKDRRLTIEQEEQAKKKKREHRKCGIYIFYFRGLENVQMNPGIRVRGV